MSDIIDIKFDIIISCYSWGLYIVCTISSARQRQTERCARVEREREREGRRRVWCGRRGRNKRLVFGSFNANCWTWCNWKWLSKRMILKEEETQWTHFLYERRSSSPAHSHLVELFSGSSSLSLALTASAACKLLDHSLHVLITWSRRFTSTLSL